MSITQVSLILFTVFLLSAGQIPFKLTSSEVNLSLSGLISLLLGARQAIAFLGLLDILSGLADSMWCL